MSLFTVGRVCVKIAGRDAGNKCVVIDVVNENFVMIDGATRRKKVNIKHIEPLAEILSLKEGATHEQVAKAFEEKGWTVWNTNAKKVGPRLRKQKKARVVAEKKPVKAKVKE